MPEPAVIVTGAAGGIGRAACIALARRGANVLVVDRDEPGVAETVTAVEAAGGAASPFTADVTDAAQVAAYVRACVDRFGGVDGFFNNAGYEGVVRPLTDYPLDDFGRIFDVNVRGVFLGLKEVIPAMRRRGGGSIVNTSSQAGLRGVPNLGPYAASKHAVVGLSRAAALETAADGIRVNTLCPGPTDTRMTRALVDQVLQAGGTAAFVERVPVGRYGEPEEIASVAVWLLLDAPAFLTGAEITCDGAMTTP